MIAACYKLCCVHPFNHCATLAANACSWRLASMFLNTRDGMLCIGVMASVFLSMLLYRRHLGRLLHTACMTMGLEVGLCICWCFTPQGVHLFDHVPGVYQYVLLHDLHLADRHSNIAGNSTHDCALYLLWLVQHALVSMTALTRHLAAACCLSLDPSRLCCGTSPGFAQ